MCEFFPVPCLRFPVCASAWAASSFRRTVPGTCESLWSDKSRFRVSQGKAKDGVQGKGVEGHTFQDTETHDANRVNPRVVLL